MLKKQFGASELAMASQQPKSTTDCNLSYPVIVAYDPSRFPCCVFFHISQCYLSWNTIDNRFNKSQLTQLIGSGLSWAAKRNINYLTVANSVRYTQSGN